MRLILLLILSSACAAHPPKAAKSAPPSEPPVDSVQLRACESCRHELELCKQRSETVQGAPPSACMDQFMSCIALQQLDTARCAGMN